MGPWMADTIRDCNGLVDMMSYWTFSDVFEEQGVVKKPFYGGYGLHRGARAAEAGVQCIQDAAPAWQDKNSRHSGDEIIATKRNDGLAGDRAVESRGGLGHSNAAPRRGSLDHAERSPSAAP